MQEFNWNQYFVTGFPEVDNQHHHLVDIINQFGSILAEEEVHMKDIDDLFNQLAEYTVYHFQEEEKLMSINNVDVRHLNAHVDMHKRFLEDVTALYASVSNDHLDQANDFLKFLTNWLAYHILGQDQDMAKQLRAI